MYLMYLKLGTCEVHKGGRTRFLDSLCIMQSLALSMVKF